MASFHPKILWPHGIWHEIVLAAEGCLTHDPTVGWETSPVAGTDRPSSRYLAGMTSLRRAIPLLVAGSLATALLAGCGGDDDSGASDEPSASPPSASPSTGQPSEPSESPTPEALDVDFGKPAKGAKISGTTYSYRVPVDWIDNTASAREVNSEIDTSGAEADGSDGFRNNVTVTSIVAAGGNLDDLEADLLIQLEDVAKEIEQRDRVLLAGRPMAHHSGTIKAKPVNYLLDQYSGIDDEGRVTVITFSYARDVPAKARKRTTHAILASWKW